jgi:hypothetical protein
VCSVEPVGICVLARANVRCGIIGHGTGMAWAWCVNGIIRGSMGISVCGGLRGRMR